MANTAAHLVDRVLPDVPVRQYVLTLPYELRKLAAFKAGVLTALTSTRACASPRATTWGGSACVATGRGLLCRSRACGGCPEAGSRN
jgi:hypothetical protein